MNLPLADLHRASSPAVRASGLNLLLGRDLPRPRRLNQAAQTLACLVGGHFNLIVMRRPRPLLDSLQLTGDIGRLLENLRKFSFQRGLFRVHAFSQ